MASADDATHATITQEHKFVVVNRLTFLPRLSPAEIDLIEAEWNDGRPIPGPTSGRPGFGPRPELNGAVSCIGRLQPTTALNPQDAAALALGIETGLFLGGVFFEPLDWAITAREIYDEPGNPWSYAGLVPFVPAGVGKLGRYGDDIAPVAAKRIVASEGPPARGIDISPNRGARPSLPMSIDDAINEVRRGGDVIAESRDAARRIAEQAGDGPPMWDPPHGPGQKPHWHPTNGGERAPGHVLY